MIFEPWMNSLKELGCKFLEGRRVTEFSLDEETGQSIQDEPIIVESPQHSTGTEVLEINAEAPPHMDTILEDQELYADDMAVSEAADSHTAPIPDGLLNIDAEDEVAQFIQEPVADDEFVHGSDSHDGENVNIALDPDKDLDELLFPEDMPRYEKQRRLDELDAKNNRKFYDAELNSNRKDTSYPISVANASQHLERAEQSIANPDILTNLKDSTLLEIQKQLAPLIARHDKMEANQVKLEATQDKISSKLDEVQQSMELIVTLLLGDDAKKGEKVLKSKCKQLQLKDADDKDGHDAGGNGKKKELVLRKHGGDLIGSSGTSKTTSQSRQGGEMRRSEWQVSKIMQSKELTVAKTQTLKVTNVDEDQCILEIEAGAIESQYLQALKVKGKKTTLFYKDPKIQNFDSEVSRRIFERENPGVDMEQLRPLEEEYKSLKSTNTDVVLPFEDISGSRPTKGVKKISEKSKSKPKAKSKKKSLSKSSKAQTLIDPIYPVVAAHDDVDDQKIQEEEVNQFHKRRKMIPGADWAEKLKLITTYDNACRRNK
ncbi:hypothetical protein AgCh_038357 [Apium graveolens]